MNRKKSNGKRWLFTGAMITAIIVLSVFTVGIAVTPAGANEKLATVTRDLPDYVEPNEEFVVTLTQSGFLIGAGIVWEVLPGGFEYVDGSYTGGGDVDWDPVTRTLMMQFFGETSIAYRANAGSNDQTAVFSGTYRAIVGDPQEEEGDITGDTEVNVDGTPPYTDEHNPAKGATGVPVGTNVVAHVKDNSEVDPYTIAMTVNGNPVSPSIIPAGPGTTNDWVVRYNPLVDFGSGEVVNVTINASDEAGNAMPTDLYSFTTVGPPVPRPDLTVTAITLNCGYLFANESNTVNATIKNNGTADAGAFNVSFDIDGFSDEVRVISGLAMGASEEVTVMDPSERNAGESVTITVTADCNTEIDESNEANNDNSTEETVVNNGYKGKRYTGGEDIVTIQNHTLRGNLTYSVGDSYYLSASTYPHWTTYTANWTASDLPVPGDATIEKARLYVPYTWDKAGVMPDEVSLKFNGIAQTRDKHYSDDRVVPDSKPYGMLAYNVTADFDKSGNSAVLTNAHAGGGEVSIRGMLLVVIYADESEAQRDIFINEGFDLLYGGSAKCTTPEEATAFAPFAGTIGDIVNKSARLITVAPGAGPNEGELIFNGNVWTDVWNFAGATQIGIDDRDVTAYLDTTANEARFQSSEDWMEASNAILVVETIPEDTEAPVVTNPNASLSIIPDDTDNIPLPEATDPNCWDWTYTGKRWETSQLNVSVTDASNIVSVKINLSSLGGDAEQEMTNIPGTDIWTVITNASNSTAGWNGTAYVPYPLQVTATDEYANSNTAVSIPLTVMNNGDVNEDGSVNFADVTYLSNHVVGTPGYESIEDTVADVNGDGSVNFADVTYLSNHVVGTPGYEVLK